MAWLAFLDLTPTASRAPSHYPSPQQKGNTNTEHVKVLQTLSCFLAFVHIVPAARNILSPTSHDDVLQTLTKAPPPTPGPFSDFPDSASPALSARGTLYSRHTYTLWNLPPLIMRLSPPLYFELLIAGDMPNTFFFSPTSIHCLLQIYLLNSKLHQV